MILTSLRLGNSTEQGNVKTTSPASIFGIHDRGLLRRGMAADLLVFDPKNIDLEPPEKVTDLPAGAPRYIQRAKGVHYTIVNGKFLMTAHTRASIREKYYAAHNQRMFFSSSSIRRHLNKASLKRLKKWHRD